MLAALAGKQHGHGLADVRHLDVLVFQHALLEGGKLEAVHLLAIGKLHAHLAARDAGNSSHAQACGLGIFQGGNAALKSGVVEIHLPSLALSAASHFSSCASPSSVKFGAASSRLVV